MRWGIGCGVVVGVGGLTGCAGEEGGEGEEAEESGGEEMERAHFWCVRGAMERASGGELEDI